MEKVKIKNGFKIINVEKDISEEQLEENRQAVLEKLYKIFYNDYK